MGSLTLPPVGLIYLNSSGFTYPPCLAPGSGTRKPFPGSRYSSLMPATHVRCLVWELYTWLTEHMCYTLFGMKLLGRTEHRVPARGKGAAARRAALPVGTVTTREQDIPGNGLCSVAKYIIPLSMIGGSGSHGQERRQPRPPGSAGRVPPAYVTIRSQARRTG